MKSSALKPQLHGTPILIATCTWQLFNLVQALVTWQNGLPSIQLYYTGHPVSGIIFCCISFTLPCKELLHARDELKLLHLV